MLQQKIKFYPSDPSIPPEAPAPREGQRVLDRWAAAGGGAPQRGMRIWHRDGLFSRHGAHGGLYTACDWCVLAGAMVVLIALLLNLKGGELDSHLSTSDKSPHVPRPQWPLSHFCLQALPTCHA